MSFCLFFSSILYVVLAQTVHEIWLCPGRSFPIFPIFLSPPHTRVIGCLYNWYCQADYLYCCSSRRGYYWRSAPAGSTGEQRGELKEVKSWGISWVYDQMEIFSSWGGNCCDTWYARLTSPIPRERWPTLYHTWGFGRWTTIRRDIDRGKGNAVPG